MGSRVQRIRALVWFVLWASGVVNPSTVLLGQEEELMSGFTGFHFLSIEKSCLFLLKEQASHPDVLEADAKQIAEMARQTFDTDGPLLVVASGRDTIPVSSAIKHLAPENVFVVQIQHPRSHLNRFDLVITPLHDYYPLTPEGQGQIPWFLRRWITPREPPGSNVVLTVGALHQADFTALRNAASAWHAELAPLPRPLLVVNIGGPARNCSYGVDLGKRLAAMLQNVLWSCGCVRISFSRRTPEKLSRILMKEFGTNPKVYIWDGEGCNPHMGHLACADAFVITADSVSMLSEACSTGLPELPAGTRSGSTIHW
ncbi:hypothetical protein PRUPE_7G101400 [Prunus persica]|uniref:Mitochondrial fission protein ELM1 n=1 Tax=Prunus persica TaxID=3760 RepID=A0A251N9K8_PRUPE|nr:hypothetical protein PRUPE_7G101400 [Prunus persica]